MYIVPVPKIDSKNILRMFSRIRPDRRIAIAITPSEKALFEQIPFGMNRDILQNPILCGTKNDHLITWIPHTETMCFKIP